MRDVLRGSLACTLRGVSDTDRLAAAWAVICGRTLADRGSILGVEGGVLQVEVVDPIWVRQLTSMRTSLAAQLTETSGVKVHKIEFAVPRSPAS